MRIRIEPSSGVPISRQLADQIRSQCVVGTLTTGDRVPSVRELAHELAVNQNTVLHVYERLSAEGWLETRQGSGTFVKSNAATSGEKKAQTAALLAQLRRAAQLAQLLGVPPDELHDLLDQSLNVETDLILKSKLESAPRPAKLLRRTP